MGVVISKLDPLEDYKELYRDYIGVVRLYMGDLILRSSKGSG